MSDDLDRRISYVVVVHIKLRHVFKTLRANVDGEEVDCEVMYLPKDLEDRVLSLARPVSDADPEKG